MRRIVNEYVAEGEKAPRRLAEAESSCHQPYWRHEPPIGEKTTPEWASFKLLDEA